ncbi:MAG: tRNA (adenine-N1)-methyltransferase [Candidatus Hodarchaeales archaeon]|jgi:tRNA (adenine57-N1/adenine58-N1)-methyltransferase
MIKEGETIQALEISHRSSKSWIFSLEKDAELSTHLGMINHNMCIGGNYGDILHLAKGRVILLKPSPRDYIRHFKLKTQILYEDDCAIACSLAGIGPGMKVGEAGTGSGALTAYLANYVRPTGRVFSFDINPKHITNAMENLRKTELFNYVSFSVQDICSDLNLIEPLDAFFLDFSAPYDAIDGIVQVLKGGGHLICFVPNWSQVEKTVQQIRENSNLIHYETFEITRRNFVVDPTRHIMRPVFRDLVYSGILIHAIRNFSSKGDE